MRILSTFLLSCIGYAAAQTDCSGVKNTQPVLDIPAQPLKTVANGQSWLMKQDSNVVYIARVKGTAYEMGYAYGQLYGQELANNLQNLRLYAQTKLHDVLGEYGVPSLMIDYLYTKVEPLAMDVLDLNYQIAQPFIPQRFNDEIKGMADGSNGLVDYNMLWRANMFPELIQAACTVFGAFGSATEGGKLLHLRALDFEYTAPINQYPTVIIYEPTEPGSHTFANIGYMGLIGTLTSISKIGISIGEKVMYADPKDYPVPPHITYVGKPWMLVLRDAVQFANNVLDVETMFQTSNRTMMIHLGVGSLPDNLFRGVDYAANFVTFYTDKNYTHYSSPAHPQMDGVFFYNKHVQPSGNQCMGSIISAAHGHITPETMFQDVAGLDETGDAQVVVMDPAGQQIWASWSEYQLNTQAYKRSPIHIRLSDFWGIEEAGFLE